VTQGIIVTQFEDFFQGNEPVQEMRTGKGKHADAHSEMKTCANKTKMYFRSAKSQTRNCWCIEERD
jgi:hypothetical protein